MTSIYCGIITTTISFPAKPTSHAGIIIVRTDYKLAYKTDKLILRVLDETIGNTLYENSC